MSVIEKEENNELTANDVRVVSENPRVFLEELHGMPPERDVEFTAPRLYLRLLIGWHQKSYRN